MFLLLPKILISFVSWYFLRRPSQIYQMAVSYIAVVLKLYSFPFLVRTLFATWRGISIAYPDNSWHIVEILQAIIMNTVSRVAGAIIRGFTIIYAIILILLIFFGSVSYLIIWYTFWFSIPLLVIWISKFDPTNINFNSLFNSSTSLPRKFRI